MCWPQKVRPFETAAQKISKMEVSSNPSLSCVFLLRSDARWHGLWRWRCKGGPEEASRRPVQWQVVQDPESPGSFHEATDSAQRQVDKIWRGLILLLKYFLIINLFTLLPAGYHHEMRLIFKISCILCSEQPNFLWL